MSEDNLVCCKYQDAGCRALLYPEDIETHYRDEAATHLQFLDMKLQIETQTNTLHKEAQAKSEELLRKLKSENKLLTAENKDLKEKLQQASHAQSHLSNLEEQLRVLREENANLQKKDALQNLPLLLSALMTSTHLHLAGSETSSPTGSNPDSTTQSAGSGSAPFISPDLAKPSGNPATLFQVSDDSGIDQTIESLHQRIPSHFTGLSLDQSLQRIQERFQAKQSISRSDPLTTRAIRLFENLPSILPSPSPPAYAPPKDLREDPWRDLYTDPRTLRTEKELFREMKTLSHLAQQAARENDLGRPGAGNLQYGLEKEIMKIQGHLHLRRQVDDYVSLTKMVDSQPV